MKRFLAPLFFIIFFSLPLFAHANTFTFSDSTVDILVDIQKTKATITIDSQKKQYGLPTQPGKRIVGIRVWDNQARTGNPIFTKEDPTIRSTVTAADVHQVYQLTNLPVGKTFYLQYLTYNSNPSIRADLNPSVFSFSDSYLLTLKTLATNINASVNGPVDPNTDLSLLVRTDTSGGAVGQNAKTDGDGFVKIVPLGKIYASVALSSSITNLDPNKTYYVDLLKKNSDGTYTVLYKGNIQTQGKETVPFDELTITPKGSGIVMISGKIDVYKYNQLHPDNKVNYATDIVQSPIIGTYAKDIDLKTDPKIAKSRSSELGAEGISTSDGTYVWLISQLDNGPTYFFKQSIVTKNGTAVEDKVYQFNTDKGLVLGTTQQDFEEHSYRLLAPFPGFTVVMDPALCDAKKAKHELPPNAICDVNDLLNFAFKMLIGAAAVLLVFRLMLAGYQYITTDVPFLKNTAKTHLAQSALGILLALSAYLILNTINPKLVTNDFKLSTVQVGVEKTKIDDAGFYNLTGEHLKTKSEYMPLAKKAADDAGVNFCALQATIQVESEWDAGAIGCDENHPFSDVPSRRAFVQSGITYDGKKFAATTNVKIDQGNPCKYDKTKPGFGLDWRFSKGGGLTQYTLPPDGYKTDAWYAGVKENGTYWNSRTTPPKGWEALLKPEENLKKGAERLKIAFDECNGDVKGAFRHYQTNNCSGGGDDANKTVARKYDLYQQCVKGS